MSKLSAEEVKVGSGGLRARIAEEVADPSKGNVAEVESLLMKFHGTYQQDDRDLRAALAKEKKDKAWQFMVRSKMPGGRLTAAQWLMHDDLARKGGGSIRLTNRQGIQLHGVLKGTLKEVIATINRGGLTTIGACGDVVRNTMSPAAPVRDPVHDDLRRVSEELSSRFLWRSEAYTDIWLDGEKLRPAWAEAEVNPEVRRLTGHPEGAEAKEPIYGRAYLPRKFKIGIALPPSNDVDVYSQDLGLIANVVDGVVDGFTVVVGGGFGMSHGQTVTRPYLARPLFYVGRAHVVDAAEAVVTVQRDFGNRADRKQARLKYLIRDRGIHWFREEVTRRLPGIPLSPAKEVHFETVEDRLGWNEQGDGRLYCAVYVSMGRVVDAEGRPAWQSAFRGIAEQIGCPFVITPNANVILADIEPSRRAEVEAILERHRIPRPESLTATRRVAHACVALPTCGLSLSESERVLPNVLDRIDDILRELKIDDVPVLVRMTGCPNGCGRPYNADFGFVGRGPNKYAMYVGGSIAGTRLAGLEEKVVTLDEIPAKVRPFLEAFARERNPGERFSEWFARARETGPQPDADHFHVEFAERAARLAAAKAGAAPDAAGLVHADG